MKFRLIVCLAWLAIAGCVFAQPSRPGEPNSIESMYGAGSAAQPQLPKPPPPAPAATNTTANSTTNSSPTDVAPDTANTTAANATLAPTVTGSYSNPLSPTSSGALSAELANVPLPVSMDNIDNDHQLEPGDKIIVKILEDGDPPMLLFVDEKGNVNVPWINRPMQVEGLTLHDAIANMKKALLTGKDGKPLNYYQDGHPTILAAYFSNDRSRGRADVDGEVQHPSYVSIPLDSILTISDAIRAAGGFTTAADREHVAVFHHDVKDPSKDTKEIVNMGELSNGIIANNPVLAGDTIVVPSKAETGAFYTISGKGAGRGGRFPIQPGMTVSNAVQQSGYDNFSDLSSVQLHRDVKGPNGATTETVKTVNVENILNNGDKRADIELMNGDWIVVGEKWIAW